MDYFVVFFAMNMVTQIIYLGRMEVGDWYYIVFVFTYLFNGLKFAHIASILTHLESNV